MKIIKHPSSKAKSPRVVRKNKIIKSVESIRLLKQCANLRAKVRQQSAALLAFKSQLNLGVVKQEKSNQQIHILHKAMEATAEGIFIIDAQKQNFPVIYANQSFQAMTGYTKREIIGRNYFLLYGVGADPRIIDEMKNTMREGKVFHGEMLNFQKNGKKYWNLLRLAPVRDHKGTVTYYIGIETDVTLMRQRDLEIKEQREELLHVTRVGKLAEFVSSLAHEISQPLTAILSYAQAAQKMIANPTTSGVHREPQIREIFQYIINDDQRAAEVIRRLRSLLKKSEPEMKLLDVNAMIMETVVIITTDLHVRSNILNTELATKLPLVKGDRIQLQQVLLNLISNSFDAMEGSRNSREMLIRTTLHDSQTIRVEVKDSGCGIPKKNLPKLFAHFFTSKPDGLGMGLSISRSIIEAHGGHLEGKNNSDRGATFTFTIPVIKKDSL